MGLKIRSVDDMMTVDFEGLTLTFNKTIPEIHKYWAYR